MNPRAATRQSLLPLVFGLLFFAALTLLADVSAAWAQVGWPTPSAWSPVRTRNFNNIRDVTGDMSPPNADLSSRGWFKGLTIGDMNSVEWYSDGQTVFIRYLLSGNPLSFNSQLNT